jgi:hypothetical protein
MKYIRILRWRGNLHRIGDILGGRRRLAFLGTTARVHN